MPPDVAVFRFRMLWLSDLLLLMKIKREMEGLGKRRRNAEVDARVLKGRLTKTG